MNRSRAAVVGLLCAASLLGASARALKPGDSDDDRQHGNDKGDDDRGSRYKGSSDSQGDAGKYGSQDYYGSQSAQQHHPPPPSPGGQYNGGNAAQGYTGRTQTGGAGQQGGAGGTRPPPSSGSGQGNATGTSTAEHGSASGGGSSQIPPAGVNDALGQQAAAAANNLPGSRGTANPPPPTAKSVPDPYAAPPDVAGTQVSAGALPAPRAGLLTNRLHLPSLLGGPAPESPQTPAGEPESSPSTTMDPLSRTVSLPGASGEAQASADPGAGGGNPEQTSNALAASAKAKLDMQDYAGAIEDSSKAIALSGDNAKAYNVRAAAKNLTGKYLEAQADSMISLEKHPQDNPAARENLAYSKLKQKKFAAAIQEADEAVRLDANNARVRAVRAYAKQMTGDKKGMLEDIEAAAALDPRFSEKARAARTVGRIYDPDADDASALAGAVAAAKSGLENWPVAAGAALVLVAGGLGAFALFRRRRPALEPLARLAARPKIEEDGVLSGKYRLGRLVGRGGMGEVYEALDTTLNRPVAVKKLVQDLSDSGPQWRAYFTKEARTVAALHHPAIVDIYEILEGEDVYLVFEYVRGKTVHQILAESVRLPLDRAAEILKPVCEALEFAHGHNLVHRDLKPANIMVTEQGHVKLMDFGIARGVAERAAPAAAPGAGDGRLQFDRTKTVAGTPAYMAPEAEQGLVSRQADVYSLGVCLYEMLTGRRPFGPNATAMEKLQMGFVRASQMAPLLPPAVDALIESALNPDPAKRLQTPREFKDRLEASAKNGAVPRA